MMACEAAIQPGGLTQFSLVNRMVRRGASRLGELRGSAGSPPAGRARTSGMLLARPIPPLKAGAGQARSRSA